MGTGVIKYKIADIAFEAEGDTEFIERERKVFFEDILPKVQTLLYAKDEPPTAEEPEKTRLSDCRACWCNTCAKLEDCDMIRADQEPDNMRPNPCAGCFDGMRLMPREAEAVCGEYEEFDGENNG